MGSSRPEAPTATWWQALWSRFWTLPALIASTSLGLGLLLPGLDASFDEPPAWLFQGGVDGARSLLGTIAGAMISVTGLVFSITIVILQLASSQFTPRILGTFLDSRIPQVTLGVFTGSFLYALTVLRSIRGGDAGTVPHIAVTVSYGYVVLAVAMFLAFIHHITESVRVTHVLQQVRSRTMRTIQEFWQDTGTAGAGWSPRPDTPRTPLALGDRCGYVTVLAGTVLVGRAKELGVVLDLDVGPGDFLVPGQVVGRGWGRDDLSQEEVCDALASIHLAEERSMHLDTGFGVRQLLDIAERALSPGVNDPTTAIQAVNELHVVLRALVQRPDPSAYLSDDDGVVRCVYRPQSYAQHLDAVVAELVTYGADSVRVVPRLRAMLDDLLEVGRPGHRASTTAALERVRARSG
jgi:uncharacterized membrane protein